MRINNSERRHDIDWLRVIAIGLLIIYHVSIGFQSWGLMIGFISNKESWTSLWIAMSLINIWRIPLLFFISGMGVFFALQKRNWKQLIQERSKRILLPFIFGMLFVVPVHFLILQKYYAWNISYSPSPSHLWFLGNIFIYIVLMLPFFIYLKNTANWQIVAYLKRAFSSPLVLLIVVGCFVLEAVIVKPMPYELYAMTIHGFLLGLLAFLFGYLFVLCGKPFCSMILTWRWLFFLAAMLLYIYRIYQNQIPAYQLSIESNLWIFCILAFAYKYLNSPSRTLSYLSESAYPVYIIHMIVLYGAAYLVFPLNLDVKLKFVLVAVCTLAGTLGLYELFIRRIAIIRPLFGLKIENNRTKSPSLILKET